MSSSFKGIEEYREKVKAGEITPLQRNPKERYEDSPKSLKLAIGAFCYECMGYEAGYISGIKDCSANSCPLYNHRPYKRRNDG